MLGWLLTHMSARWHVLKREWLTFVAVAVLAAVAAFFGARAMFSQQVSDQQAQISALRNELMAQAMNTAMATAIPSSQWRRLSDDERASLLAGFKAHRSVLNGIVIYAMTDPESRQYASQFFEVFRQAGVTILPRQVPLDMSVDVGLVIGLVHSDQPPPETAQALTNILNDAGLSVHYNKWHPSNPMDADRAYCFFIGPMPWTGKPPAGG
jgi:hypothetical protein